MGVLNLENPLNTVVALAEEIRLSSEVQKAQIIGTFVIKSRVSIFFHKSLLKTGIPFLKKGVLLLLLVIVFTNKVKIAGPDLCPFKGKSFAIPRKILSDNSLFLGFML